jgi:PAS domain S-box-containing protein
MPLQTLSLEQAAAVAQRTETLFQEELMANRKRTDRMFAWLMAAQWLAGIMAALWISPRTWDGQQSQTHIHLWAAIFLGGLISGFPILMAVIRPGTVLTRHVIAVGQMLTSGLLVHLTGGRIETHFHYFGSLAFLAFYRDWQVMLTATAVVTIDHFARGVFWPQSIFGVQAAGSWRWLEHAAWVLFENVFLLLAIQHNRRELRGGAERQARLESVNEIVELRVNERTQELKNEIAERRRAEESLRLLGSAVEQAKEAILITDAELDLPGPRIIFVNPAFTQMTGYAAAEVIGKTPRLLQGPSSDRSVLDRLRQNLQRGEGFAGETVNYRKDGTEFELEWQIAPLRNADGATTHFVAIQRDITLRKQMEARLLQSQKLETVGKLAGGVAHEFNSILTAIIGQGELLRADLPAGSPLAGNVTSILQAANRASTLTRQLLAFGRKQFLQPEILDLNLTLAGMQDMFHHLMGPDITTQIIPAPGLHAVRADAGQIEQVIVNMAINARDAMPNGGKLLLETANVLIDGESLRVYPELKPGHYVMLAITDSGYGMSDEVRARAFEPFFSTKGVGQGTGLGLSTCDGIIKQSGGHITIYSEPGWGTTFKIYLPRVEQEPATVPPPSRDSAELPTGTETVLLVEDDPALRDMAATLLRRLGYTVWEAGNGVEALNQINNRSTEHIDLLFTDVVMPHMSGGELADLVRAISPRTKVLFTSAYTENTIIHQGVLEKNAVLLQKPFTPSALARKIREVLEAKRP